MMKTYLCIAVLLPLLIATSVPAGEGDGGYAGVFLQVPIGARPTGMGGAYLAVSNDGAGALYNPAGLVTLQRLTFATSYRAMKLDRSLGYVSLLIPVENRAVLGFNWLYAGSGSVVARDNDGYELDHEISQNNHDFSAIFAKRFEKFLSVGMKLNYYHLAMTDISASSIGFDFGVMLYIDQLFDRERRVDLPVKDMQIGLTAKYINVKFPWNSEKYNLAHTGNTRGYEQRDQIPVEIGLGGSARVLKRKLLLAVDLLKNVKQGPEFHAGGEYSPVPEVGLRAGFGDGRFSVGAGHVMKLGKQILAVDYAFSTDKADEGSEHIFSFDLLF
jgi:hypothetical protein